jgi:type IV secretory pathway TrbF-like protein
MKVWRYTRIAALILVTAGFAAATLVSAQDRLVPAPAQWHLVCFTNLCS